MVALMAGPVWAESFKARLINGMTKMETIAVGDEEGHVVGVYERKGVTMYENGEVANEVTRGTFDSAKGWQGYCLQTFQDGSTMWMRHRGSMRKGKVVEATFELIGGTGRYEGIKGSGTFTGGYVAYAEDSRAYGDWHFTGTYTLPKK
jgi:hypothetical protein